MKSISPGNYTRKNCSLHTYLWLRKWGWQAIIKLVNNSQGMFGILGFFKNFPSLKWGSHLKLFCH